MSLQGVTLARIPKRIWLPGIINTRNGGTMILRVARSSRAFNLSLFEILRPINKFANVEEVSLKCSLP